MEWINKLNEMLEENPYTNGNKYFIKWFDLFN